MLKYRVLQIDCRQLSFFVRRSARLDFSIKSLVKAVLFERILRWFFCFDGRSSAASRDWFLPEKDGGLWFWHVFIDHMTIVHVVSGVLSSTTVIGLWFSLTRLYFGISCEIYLNYVSMDLYHLIIRMTKKIASTCVVI